MSERREICTELRRVPVPNAADRRDRADAEAEIVTAAPVREIVPRAKIATAAIVRPAEIRRLVPAVARCDERLDHGLEVGLHRLGLAHQLLAVGVREARARLRLELVAGEMLGPKLERLLYVGC